MYAKFSNSELLSLLKTSTKLTLNSKLSLKEVLLQRNLQEEAEGLQHQIDADILEIKNLMFLPRLGFQIEWISNNSFQLTRTTKAIWVDILAVVLGLSLLILGIHGLAPIIASFFGEDILDVTNFSLAAIKCIFGVLGFNMFYAGMNRLAELSRLKLFVDENIAILNKQNGFKSIEIKAAKTAFQLLKEKENLILKLENETILKGSNKNMIQRLTILELFEKTK